MASTRDRQRGYVSKRLWEVPSGPLGLPTQRAVVFRSAPWWLCAAPDFQRTQSTISEADQVAWRAALGGFVERGRKGGPFGPQPSIGSLSIREWGRLACLHNDHHLRQFGV